MSSFLRFSLVSLNARIEDKSIRPPKQGGATQATTYSEGERAICNLLQNFERAASIDESDYIVITVPDKDGHRSFMTNKHHPTAKGAMGQSLYMLVGT